MLSLKSNLCNGQVNVGKAMQLVYNCLIEPELKQSSISSEPLACTCVTSVARAPGSLAPALQSLISVTDPDAEQDRFFMEKVINMGPLSCYMH